MSPQGSWSPDKAASFPHRAAPLGRPPSLGAACHCCHSPKQAGLPFFSFAMDWRHEIWRSRRVREGGSGGPRQPLEEGRGSRSCRKRPTSPLGFAASLPPDLGKGLLENPRGMKGGGLDLKSQLLGLWGRPSCSASQGVGAATQGARAALSCWLSLHGCGGLKRWLPSSRL